MTALIDPVINRALTALYLGPRPPGAGSGAGLEAALRRRLDQAVLFRSSGGLELDELFLGLLTPELGRRAAALRPTAGDRARVARGWGAAPLADGAPLAAPIEALRQALSGGGAAGDRRLFEESLAEIAAYRQATALAGPGDGPPPPPPQAALPPEPPGPITAEGRPGISLVSCCMNRNDNLMRVMPSWLAHPEISEILVIDWSSQRPVAADLAAAGFRDRRIRVVRVEGEARWVLGYAFNLGFRLAACERVLKADADILLGRDFFARNRLAPGDFIAGDWREAAPDQPHVNGFFFIEKAALARIGGFNEHITTYGWDDEDLYARLSIAGTRRVSVAAGTIHHLPHDDAARTGTAAAPRPGQTTEARLMDGTAFLIRRNRFVAATMPDWNRGQTLLPFVTGQADDGRPVLRRQGWVPSEVPQTILDQANQHGLRELLSWELGRVVLELDGRALQALLARAAGSLTPLDALVARADPARVAPDGGRYLVVSLPQDVLDRLAAKPGAMRALDRAVQRAGKAGLHPLLRLDARGAPAHLAPGLRARPVIPAWEATGPLTPLTPQALARGDWPGTGHLQLQLDLDGLEQLGAAVAAPASGSGRGKFFVDVQHGLGNRLRAMASAAAIAEEMERDLVVIWAPDAHCDCRLGDLFDYGGAVEQERFLERAAQGGAAVHDLMTATREGRAEQRIDDAPGRDIYVRSAFVLPGHGTWWEAENHFLQALRPVEAVRDLVAGVRQPNDLAVHVRMQGGQAHEHLPFESPDNWSAEDHARIAEWRAKSHFAHFLRRIDTLAAQGGAERIFLAADLPETYAVFAQAFGARLAWLPRQAFDRSKEQLQYALADAMLLARAPRLLGSGWSSFSELAMRLAPQKQAVEMSGTDF